MQTNRKKVGIALIIFGLLLIVLIIYFGFLRRDKGGVFVPVVEEEVTPAQLEPAPEEITTTPSDRPADESRYDLSKEKPHVIDGLDLTKRAEGYAERLGSYSSQSDYSNFTSLKAYMTPAMQSWVDTEVEKLRANNSGDSYYGIVTRALTANIDSFDDEAGKAEVSVMTERRESRSEIGGGESFRQEVKFSFVKSGSAWLIDAAYWQ